MKLAGILLLLAGWGIAISAVALLPSLIGRSVFVLSGIAVELLGLALMTYSHLFLKREKG